MEHDFLSTDNFRLFFLNPPYHLKKQLSLPPLLSLDKQRQNKVKYSTNPPTIYHYIGKKLCCPFQNLKFRASKIHVLLSTYMCVMSLRISATKNKPTNNLLNIYIYIPTSALNINNSL